MDSIHWETMLIATKEEYVINIKTKSINGKFKVHVASFIRLSSVY